MAKAKIENVRIDNNINTVYVTYSTGTEKLYPANKLPKTVQAWIDSHKAEEPEQEPEPETESITATEQESKDYYFVSFQYSNTIYCSNIAHAASAEDVEREYSKYQWSNVRPVQYGELEIARLKGMPIIEIDHEEPEGTDTEPVEEAATVEAVAEEEAENIGGITEIEPEEAEREDEMKDRNEIITQEPESLLAFADSMGAAEGVGFILMMGAAAAWFIIAGLAGLAIEAIKTAAFLLWDHRQEIRQAGANTIEAAAEWIKAATKETRTTAETVKTWTKETAGTIKAWTAGATTAARKAGRKAADTLIIFVGDHLISIPMTSTTAVARMAARMTVLCIGILAILA